jgi:UPF0755 protein
MLKAIIYIFTFCFFIFIAIGGFFIYGLYQIYAPPGGAEAEIFEIQSGQGIKEIGEALKRQGLIRSPFWFKAYVWLSDAQAKMQAGQYSISRSLSLAQIVGIFSEGKIIEDGIWLAIPEGFTLKQIKARLAESGIESAENFGDETIDAFEAEYDILGDAPDQAGLQGFLFPDTYKFKKDVGAKDVIIKMLDNFDGKITPKMRQDIKGQGRSVFEIVTMASILEKEVRGLNDKKLASGIFWKRINDRYPLQSDATLSYIFEDKKDRHSIEETKVDSPYNTYKYIGLPPGPINNPGLEAIEAAIYPQETDYYFFLTKPDTGEAVFSKTLEEHNENKLKYLK